MLNGKIRFASWKKEIIYCRRPSFRLKLCNEKKNTYLKQYIKNEEKITIKRGISGLLLYYWYLNNTKIIAKVNRRRFSVLIKLKKKSLKNVFNGPKNLQKAEQKMREETCISPPPLSSRACISQEKQMLAQTLRNITLLVPCCFCWFISFKKLIGREKRKKFKSNI